MYAINRILKLTLNTYSNKLVVKLWLRYSFLHLKPSKFKKSNNLPKTETNNFLIVKRTLKVLETLEVSQTWAREISNYA